MSYRGQINKNGLKHQQEVDRRGKKPIPCSVLAETDPGLAPAANNYMGFKYRCLSSLSINSSSL